jgi:hypothetical protein
MVDIGELDEFIDRWADCWLILHEAGSSIRANCPRTHISEQRTVNPLII